MRSFPSPFKFFFGSRSQFADYFKKPIRLLLTNLTDRIIIGLLKQITGGYEMATLTERAKQVAESVTGYNYNPIVLDEICKAGFDAIPNGAILATRGNQTLKLVDGNIVCLMDGKIAKTTPINDAAKDQAVIMYAVDQSKNPIQMGNLK
jgi:hypothetical protein